MGRERENEAVHMLKLPMLTGLPHSEEKGRDKRQETQETQETKHSQRQRERDICVMIHTKTQTQ